MSVLISAISHIDLSAFKCFFPFLTQGTLSTWHQSRVKEIIKCLFKSNLTSSDRGTRHNSKRQDSLREGGKGERCPLMDFVKRISFWATEVYPWRVHLSRVIEVSSKRPSKIENLDILMLFAKARELGACVSVIKEINICVWKPLEEHCHHQFREIRAKRGYNEAEREELKIVIWHLAHFIWTKRKK